MVSFIIVLTTLYIYIYIDRSIYTYGYESKPWHPRYPKVDGTAGIVLHPVVWCHIAIIKGNSDKNPKSPIQSHKMTHKIPQNKP